jgi:hypothetical protein
MPGDLNPSSTHDTAPRVDPYPSLGQKLSYGLRVLPSYAWQRLTRRRPHRPVHLMIALADHFEPSIVPENGLLRAPYDEQERRLELVPELSPAGGSVARP